VGENALGLRILTPMAPRIEIDPDKIDAFCRKWKIAEFALFGSVLREDFRPASDVDILVSFQPDADWSLYDWVDMIEELKQLFGRNVDLLEKTGLRNPFRRHEILTTREVIYAA
jgi:predicted nucleotidyltransferase